MSDAADAGPPDAGRPAAAGERLRLFVALDLPESVRTRLSGWARAVPGTLAGVRPLRPESLHVTLCFIGERPAHELPRLVEACRVAAAAPALTLELTEALWLPRRRPRVVAVGLVEPTGALAALQAALSERLEAGGFVAPEPRPFLAHVTVARVRSDVRSPAALPAPEPMHFVADSVTLLRSALHSGPAHYEPLATVRLGAGSPGHRPGS